MCNEYGQYSAVNEHSSVEFKIEQNYLVLMLNLIDVNIVGNFAQVVRKQNGKISEFNGNKIKNYGTNFRTVDAVVYVGDQLSSGHHTCWIRKENNQWILIDDQKCSFQSQVYSKLG